MVTEGHRLRRLQMSEAGHHGRGVAQRLFSQRTLIAGERRIDRVDRITHPQLEVGRHLIVARARGVQSPGGRTDQFAQPAFDIHMNVFERALELELARSDL